LLHDILHTVRAIR